MICYLKIINSLEIIHTLTSDLFNICAAILFWIKSYPESIILSIAIVLYTLHRNNSQRILFSFIFSSLKFWADSSDVKNRVHHILVQLFRFLASNCLKILKSHTLLFKKQNEFRSFVWNGWNIINVFREPASHLFFKSPLRFNSD